MRVHTVLVPRLTLTDLTPSQVIELQDALLHNADNLLNSAIAVLELGNAGLARSLAILALEESGKAIAIHQRRIEIAFAPEGEPFVSAALRDLWGHHDKKLRQVHDFLVQENYWFDTEPSDPEANRAVLGTIEAWAKGQNVLKQRGFYVDVEDGVTVSPSDGVDEQALRDLIGRVHQIGWQLRLGEHIEAKKQAELAESIPPASEELIDRVRSLFRDAMGGTFDESRLDGIRHGKPGIRLNNDEYRLRLPPLDANPFATMGKPGYEAQTRELLLLAEEIGLVSENDDDDAGEADAAPEG